MRVGALGDVAFNVSDKQIKTLRSLEVSHSASISVHKIHLGGGIAEFTGDEPQTITFKLRLSAYLGAPPESDLRKLDRYLTKGTPVALALGRKTYGRYKWLIENVKTSGEFYDKYGNVTQCDVAVTLKEYLKG